MQPRESTAEWHFALFLTNIWANAVGFAKSWMGNGSRWRLEQQHSKICSAATCRIEIPRLSLLCARPAPVDEEETFSNLNLNCSAIDGRPVCVSTDRYCAVIATMILCFKLFHSALVFRRKYRQHEMAQAERRKWSKRSVMAHRSQNRNNS